MTLQRRWQSHESVCRNFVPIAGSKKVDNYPSTQSDKDHPVTGWVGKLDNLSQRPAGPAAQCPHSRSFSHVFATQVKIVGRGVANVISSIRWI